MTETRTFRTALMACEDAAGPAVSQTSPERTFRCRAASVAVAFAAVVHAIGATGAMGQEADPAGHPAPPPNAPWWFTYESPTSTELTVAIHGSAGGDPTVLSMKRR